MGSLEFAYKSTFAKTLPDTIAAAAVVWPLGFSFRWLFRVLGLDRLVSVACGAGGSDCEGMFAGCQANMSRSFPSSRPWSIRVMMLSKWLYISRSKASLKR